MIGLLLVVGLVGAYWKQIALAVAVVAAVKYGREWWVRQQEAQSVEAERLAGVVERADREHRQVMSGDERGVFGSFPPAVEDRAL